MAWRVVELSDVVFFGAVRGGPRAARDPRTTSDDAGEVEEEMEGRCEASARRERRVQLAIVLLRLPPTVPFSHRRRCI
jgi:hypothetical protein